MCDDAPLQVDFIGIGAPKCGTTWLFYGLGQHPRICLSEPKEINYFNSRDFRIGAAEQHGSCCPVVNERHKNSIDGMPGISITARRILFCRRLSEAFREDLGELETMLARDLSMWR
jgi:hypothetical protein